MSFLWLWLWPCILNKHASGGASVRSIFQDKVNIGVGQEIIEHVITIDFDDCMRPGISEIELDLQLIDNDVMIQLSLNVIPCL